MTRHWFLKAVSVTALAVYGVAHSPVTAFAVVGQAERYDEFKEDDLREFQQNIMSEEKAGQMDEFIKDYTANTPAPAAAAGGEAPKVDPELASMERELLGLPKKDRFKYGLDSQYLFDTNIERKVPGYEKADSVFDINPFVQFDLSGQKTDLRFETRAGKQWNIHFPKKDLWGAEERIRYRRRYYKKIFHSIQSRFGYVSEKTIEINEKKSRIDSFQNTNFNFLVNRKLSINAEFNANKRYFTTEAFDQDSYWEYTQTPSLFWNFSPKSRVSLGYTYGTNRIRSKVGNAVSHEVHAGYFGKISRKSSVSFDAAFEHQSPRATETPTINGITVGTGYIYQFSPKTQVTLQIIRSQQNSSSVPNPANSSSASKGDVYFTHDNVSVSLNTRLIKKMTAVLTAGASHLHTKVEKSADESGETRQFSFPVTLSLDYMIKRWIRWRASYTFAFRTGDERNDSYKSHQLTTGVNMVF